MNPVCDYSCSECHPEMNEHGGIDVWEGYGPPDPGPFDMTVEPGTWVEAGGERFRFYGYLLSRSGISGWYGYRPDGSAVNRTDVFDVA